MDDPTAPDDGLAIPEHGFRVGMTLEPVARSVRPARSVAASVGVDVGMDVDDLDDLRVAVQEAMALLIEVARSTIDAVVAPVDDAVLVTLTSAIGGDAPGPSHLARQLLDVLVAAHDITVDDGLLCVRLRSHPAAGG